MVFSCCVITCRQKGGVKMHTFPYTIPELYNEWLKRIQRLDLFDMEPKRVATNYRICEKHFSDFAKIGDQCRSRTGLKKFALPNLHLPGFKELATKENSILPKCLIADKATGRVTGRKSCSESSFSTLRIQGKKEHKLKTDFDKSNKFSIENSQSEIFDINNVSASNLADFHKTACKENSLSSVCNYEVMDELFASYPKSGIDLNIFYETSSASFYLPDKQENSIKENSVLSSTMAAEHSFDTNETFDTSLTISQLSGFEENSKKRASVSLSDVTMEELFANNPELFFDLNLPFETNLPEIATFGFPELDKNTDSNNILLENLKRKTPRSKQELTQRCRSAPNNTNDNDSLASYSKT